ncbi:hypothetical protein HRJ32_06190 [Streptococcus oralis subsp. oralis]|jgi:hypothetical protein|uniref:hypothetical protein n=1 Tax=Streptococcus oralis TaxID=1303 RepID=UPI0015E61AA1|nr:hypothetical protein [Streptococcus oralis]MBA1351652.1 hypothetical protein [Streptococcus oralis subsp. oralis]
MKDKEKEPVGSLLTKNVLGVEDNESVGILEGCLILLMCLILVILLFTMLIAKWSPFDLFV